MQPSKILTLPSVVAFVEKATKEILQEKYLTAIISLEDQARRVKAAQKRRAKGA